jgi:hypothetical protein
MKFLLAATLAAVATYALAQTQAVLGRYVLVGGGKEVWRLDTANGNLTYCSYAPNTNQEFKVFCVSAGKQ